MKGREYIEPSSVSEIFDLPSLQLLAALLWCGNLKTNADYGAFEYKLLPPHVFVDHFEEI